MPATNRPQLTATMMSRRRSGDAGWPVISRSQRPDHDARSLDQGHGENQRDEHRERQRDRYRAAAAAALLLGGQNNAGFGGLLIHHEAHANTRPNGMPKCCRPSARSTRSAAKSTNR